MNSLRIKLMDRQVRFIVASIALMIALAIPAFVSAATVTERSVLLSSSAKAATGTSYTVDFAAATNGTGAFIVDFCDSSVVGTACTTPLGFNATTVATSGGNSVDAVDANTVRVELGTPVNTGEVANVILTGLTNPTNPGVMYARIVTYANEANATAQYTSAAALGTHLDSGTVALSITESIGVSGSVLETLVFCASGSAIDEEDGCAGSLTAPNVVLGTNGVLDTTASEGTINSQISTNAASGAVVNLKSDAVGCGGLKRAGAPTACNITPITDAGVATIPNGEAKFGLKLTGVDDGTGTIVPLSGYSASEFFLNYVANDQTGVTSTYGSPIFGTSDAPISNGKVSLTFGANIGNDTPAGTYSATLNLIATGKF